MTNLSGQKGINTTFENYILLSQEKNRVHCPLIFKWDEIQIRYSSETNYLANLWHLVRC